jgi:hypothetical protein
MYEGLTRHLLERTAFEGLDLRVVDGKITNTSGDLSDQIDCMLVVGEGTPIPYTNSFIYPIGQVLVVIEVKKTLYSTTLEQAYDNLSSVVRLHRIGDEKFRAARRAFRAITHRDVSSDEWADIPYGDKMLFHCLVQDSLAPLRVVFGYDGFASESGLRNAFLDYLERQLPLRTAQSSPELDKPVHGFGPSALPNLIVCADRVLVKLNGIPYSAHIVGELPSAPEGRGDNWWALYGSANGTPLLFLLEIFWTRLRDLFPMSPEIFGEDLEMEPITPLLFARPTPGKGWEYLEHRLSQHDIGETKPDTAWLPSVLDMVQFTIICLLCKDEEIDIDGDTDLHQFLSKNSLTIEAFIERMKSTGLVHVDARRQMRLITETCTTAVLADGTFVAGENSTGRLTRWVVRWQREFRARAPKALE